MLSGILNVKKEKGMTSFDVIYRLRKILGVQKMGHTGTLDPEAEGVLPVCVGKATRVVSLFMDETKTYEAVLLLGVTTDTQDMTGQVLSRQEPDVTEEQIRTAVLSFSGRQMQMPPMYSAIKIGGKKLVDLARRGVEVERTPREVEFSDMEIISIEPPHASLRVTCTKGSYIRTLCHDIGRKLGCGGAMESLVRTRVGRFRIEEALTLDEIRARKEAEDSVTRNAAEPYSFLLPLEAMFGDLPIISVKSALDIAVINGNDFSPEETGNPCPSTSEAAENGSASGYAASFPNGTEVRVHTSDGRFIGIYRYDLKHDIYHLVKNFYDPD